MAEDKENSNPDPDASKANDQNTGADKGADASAAGGGEGDAGAVTGAKQAAETGEGNQPAQQPDNSQQQQQQGGGGSGGGGAAGGGNGGGGDGWLQSFRSWLITPPGDSLVGSGAIILTSIFLMLLTVALLVGITVTWPACEYPPEQNTNANGNSNGNTNSNNNRNSNANANAVNANAANANRNAANANSNNVNSNNANTSNANTGNTNTSNANSNGATTAVAQSSPAPEASPAPIHIYTIDPTSGSVLGNTPVTIKGKNLPPDGLTVKFGETAVNSPKNTATSISARTPKHGEGVVDVSVWTKDKDGNEVEADRLVGQYTYVCAAPEGSILFWMIVMAGALGGCIHALRSLWWYTGDGSLKWKWMLMYFCLPFTGAAMAMLFGFLIVAGVIENTSGRNTSLFIIAIAGLVGMFTQQAALKLTDIANAVFTRPGEGKDSRTQPSLPPGGAAGAGGASPTITPAAGKAGDHVDITGTDLTDVASVTFGGVSAPGFTFDAATKAISGNAPPQNPGFTGNVDVTVTNAAGKSVKVSYKYT